jgi:hypothetical protein
VAHFYAGFWWYLNAEIWFWNAEFLLYFMQSFCVFYAEFLCRILDAL